MYKVTDKKGFKYTRNGRIVTLREGDNLPQKDLEKGCIKKEWLEGLVGEKRLEKVTDRKPKAKPAKGGNASTASKGSSLAKGAASNPIAPDDKTHPGGDTKHPAGAGEQGTLLES